MYSPPRDSIWPSDGANQVVAAQHQHRHAWFSIAILTIPTEWRQRRWRGLSGMAPKWQLSRPAYVGLILFSHGGRFENKFWPVAFAQREGLFPQVFAGNQRHNALHPILTGQCSSQIGSTCFTAQGIDLQIKNWG